MNYTQIKKLDEETLKKLTEGKGPTDECLCSILSPPEDEKKGFRASIKRAFASIGQGLKDKKKKAKAECVDDSCAGFNTVDIPLTFSKGGKGIYTTKEKVKRSSCGKCGCDDENIVMKHSIASIRISTPDISSICPCPSDCLPDKAKLQNNIKVTVEHLQVDQGMPIMSSERSQPSGKSEMENKE